MKFTKGLFVGTALGISAAMMMNNKSTNNNTNSTDNSNNASNTNKPNKTNTFESTYKSTSITVPPDSKRNDYIENDII